MCLHKGGGNNRGYLDICWLGLSTLQVSLRKMHFVTGLGCAHFQKLGFSGKLGSPMQAGPPETRSYWATLGLLLTLIDFKPEAEFMNVQFRSGFRAWSWEFSELRFPYTMLRIQTIFKPLLLKGWGGGGGAGDPFLMGIFKSKGENY